MKPWHPTLPASAKARRMLRKCGNCIELYDGLLSMVASETGKPESRFIIGTVAAELCLEAFDKTRNEAMIRLSCQWKLWARGKDWQ